MSTFDRSETRTIDEPAQLVPSAYKLPFVLVTTLFFLWGIPNNLNDVLIRQFLKSFAITRFQAGLLQSAFYMGYFLLAMPAALIMRKLGYKFGFLIGLSLFSLGAILFWPAAIITSYSFFLVALFVIASGLAFLETAANPFIAKLGDEQSAARRLNFAQAFNPLGSITGVLIGTVFIFSGVELDARQTKSCEDTTHMRPLFAVGNDACSCSLFGPRRIDADHHDPDRGHKIPHILKDGYGEDIPKEQGGFRAMLHARRFYWPWRPNSLASAHKWGPGVTSFLTSSHTPTNQKRLRVYPDCFLGGLRNRQIFFCMVDAVHSAE